MNKKQLLRVARALRESPNPELFTMNDYTHPCGKPACAFGHYAFRTDLQHVFWIDDTTHCVTAGHSDLDYVARAHFDLTQDELDELFGTRGCGNAVTAIEAAQYIERFVEERHAAQFVKEIEEQP